MSEWLATYEDEQSTPEKQIFTSNLLIFEGCKNLIRCIPLMQHQSDEKGDPNDCVKHPHEITHGPDAIRYFLTGRPQPTEGPAVKRTPAEWEPDQWEDYYNATPEEQLMLIQRRGDPFG
jgi:phage terminase large subunit